MPKTYVIIPTYNEAENIEELLKAILALKIDGLVPVVVDDNSPDGTGKIAERIPGVKTIIRTTDRGRGSAGIAGFKFALQEGADYIIEMDADFSHHPKYIPDILKHIKNYDVVLGSRFVPGGKDIERGFIRQITTLFAQNYIKFVLGIKVKDPTSGYRCFRRNVLEAIDLDHMLSTGPSIVSEILYKVKLKGFSIYETPIVFEDRKKGETKLNFGVLLNNLYMILKFRQSSPLHPSPSSMERGMNPPKAEKGVRILFLSNGHAEDLVADKIIKQLGSNYEAIKFPLVDATLPSGGFSLRNPSFLWKDLGAGLLGNTFKHWKKLKELRGQVNLTVAIGDIVPILAALTVKAPFIFVGVNKSSYYKTFGYNYTPWEKFLLQKYALKTFVRDRETLKDLPFAEYVGNPLLDCMALPPSSFSPSPLLRGKEIEDRGVFGFLPGTRSDASLNMEDFEKVITELINQRDESDPKLEFITATKLTALPEYIENKPFETVLAEANIIIGLSGTANEQAAACGIPVVSFPGRGSQYNRRFAQAQKELLGEALLFIDQRNFPSIAAGVWQLIKNPVRIKGMGAVGAQRMGDPGAISKIAEFIKEQLA